MARRGVARLDARQQITRQRPVPTKEPSRNRAANCRRWAHCQGKPGQVRERAIAKLARDFPMPETARQFGGRDTQQATILDYFRYSPLRMVGCRSRRRSHDRHTITSKLGLTPDERALVAQVAAAKAPRLHRI